MIAPSSICSNRVRLAVVSFWLFCAVPLWGVSEALPDLSISSGAPVQTAVTLPAGASFLRVSGDWSATSGTPASRDLELSVVGPGEISGFLPVFANATIDSDPLIGLRGEMRLTSTGGAGLYTFSFLNNADGTVVAFQNGSVELLTVQEEFTDNGTLGAASPTFERPEEDGSPSGRTTRYATYQFTPGFSGEYIIASQQVGFDGFIALYAGSQTEAPFSGFIAADDDSAAGESFSRLEVTLTAGQTYTIVSTSFSTSASGTFTNRIRNFQSLDVDSPKATQYADYALQRGFTGGPDADDSGNGLSNLLEYALGRDEASPYAPPLEIRIEAGRLISRFYRDPELTDITYILEASPDLNMWEVIYDTSTDLQPNADGAFQEIEDEQPVAGSRFFRLRIVLSGGKPVTYADYASQEGLGEPEADDNGNGLPNLLEYALGRTEDSPYEPPLEVFLLEGSLVGRFYRDPELTDIAYVLVATSDLSTPSDQWEVLYDSEIDLQPNADGTHQEIADSQPLAGSRFFRLRIRLIE